jgi:probable HAF family extracellular repeat protein
MGPRARAICIFVALVSSTSASSSFAVTRYTIAQLGGFGGYHLNESGQVSGIITYGTTSHAALIQGSTATELGTLGSATSSSAYAINEQTHIIGSSSHAFVWRDGVMSDLGTLGGTSSNGIGINDSDVMCGYSTIMAGSSTRHAFIYENGLMQDLGTLGGTSSFAAGMNNSSQIVGFSDDAATGERHAFLWSNGLMQDLGVLDGTSSAAAEINDAGVVVGGYTISTVATSKTRGFVWSNGVMSPLGVIPASNFTDYQADGINLPGDIIGSAHVANQSNTERAILWTGNETYDLGGLIDDSRWVLINARDINNRGQIIGFGTFDPDGPGPMPGANAGYILTPVPEPAAALGLLAITSLALRRRR